MFFSPGNKDHKEAAFRKNSAMAIKKWVKEKMSLDDEVTIMVTELSCSDPGCPDKETIIGIIQKDNNKKFSIKKPLLYVRKWDIDALFKL
jgi:nitrate reductase delta subunit